MLQASFKINRFIKGHIFINRLFVKKTKITKSLRHMYINVYVYEIDMCIHVYTDMDI